jgi:phage anti-repressor protein
LDKIEGYWHKRVGEHKNKNKTKHPVIELNMMKRICMVKEMEEPGRARREVK